MYDRAVRLLLLLLVTTMTLGACSQPKLRATGDSDLPSERALAAARAHVDPGVSNKTLVVLLDSADPAVRLLAIRALEERTGETLGYHFADPPEIRSEAVERWDTRVRSMGEPDALPEG